MKSGVQILNDDTIFRHSRLELLRRYGAKETVRLWKQSGTLLEELLSRYRHLPRRERRHLEKNILLGAAIYKTLQATHPEDAMAIMDSTMYTAGTMFGGTLRRIVSRPLGKGIFMWLFPRIGKRIFGPAAGFRQEILRADRRAVWLNIYDCPYCRYCKELGCPELTHIFCDSDEYSYGNLPGIRFARTGTLADGDSCCDFVVERIKKGRKEGRGWRRRK